MPPIRGFGDNPRDGSEEQITIRYLRDNNLTKDRDRYVPEDDSRHDGVRWEHLRIPANDDSDPENESAWCRIHKRWELNYQIAFAEQSHRTRIVCHPAQPVRRMVNFFANHLEQGWALVSWRMHDTMGTIFSVFDTHGCWKNSGQSSANMLLRIEHVIADYKVRYPDVTQGHSIKVVNRQSMKMREAKRGRQSRAVTHGARKTVRAREERDAAQAETARVQAKADDVTHNLQENLAEAEKDLEKQQQRCRELRRELVADQEDREAIQAELEKKKNKDNHSDMTRRRGTAAKKN